MMQTFCLYLFGVEVLRMDSCVAREKISFTDLCGCVGFFPVSFLVSPSLAVIHYRCS